MTTTQSRGTQVSRQRAAVRVLERVQRILQETCEQDGQGVSLQEVARRKAYRVGINRALAELSAYSATHRVPADKDAASQ